MIEIFVVDGKFQIHSVAVEEEAWKRGGCIGHIKNQAIFVNRGGWNKITTYAGFETRKEAEQFKKSVRKQDRPRRNRHILFR